MTQPLSYIVRTRNTITRQAGDTGSIQLVVPAELSITNYDVYFEVVDNKGESVFTRDTEEATIEKDGQNIYVLLDEENTSGLSGVYEWEMELYSDTETITIGKGQFVIIKENAKRIT